jgi:hypothetical protein
MRAKTIRISSLKSASIRRAVALALIVLPLCAAETIDLGVVGTTYEITEKPLVTAIMEAVKEVNWTQAQKDFRADFEGLYSYSHPKPACAADANSSVKHEVIVPHDIVSEGKILFRAGQKVLYKIPLGLSFSLCFIDGSKDLVPQLRAFDKASVGSCDLIASNADSRTLSAKHKIEVAPNNRVMADKTKISCYPSVVTFEGDNIRYQQLKPIAEVEQ